MTFIKYSLLTLIAIATVGALSYETSQKNNQEVAQANSQPIVQTSNGFNSNDLSDLIVTNGLFTNYSAEELAGLIAVDNITGPGMTSNDLANLITINGLFGNSSAEDLAALIAVDNINY